MSVEFQVAAGLEEVRGLSPEEIIRAMGNSSFLPGLSSALRAATGSTSQRAVTPTLYTLHSTPYTLHPTLYTLHSTP